MTALVLAWAALCAADAGAEVQPAPWVSFRSPPFTDPGLPHGGPDWSFATPSLPALAPTGDAVLVARTEIVPGGAPNLTLLVLRVSDGAVESSHVLLDATEFTAAGEPARKGDLPAATRAYAALADRVRRRIEQAETDLGGRARFRPMTACQILDPADGSQPACSMREQRIDCAGVAFRYGGGALRATGKKRAWRVRSRAFAPPPVHDAGAGTVRVRACFDGVWLAPDHDALVGLLRNECQRGGDWCIVQPRWFTARVGD
jgi:hypothetical protein